MGHVANMDADLQLDMAFGRHVMIAMSKRALNLDRALRRLQRTVKLHRERCSSQLILELGTTQSVRSAGRHAAGPTPDEVSICRNSNSSQLLLPR